MPGPLPIEKGRRLRAHNTYVRTFQQAQDPLQGPSGTLPVQIRGRRGPGTVTTLRMRVIVSTLILFSRL